MYFSTPRLPLLATVLVCVVGLSAASASNAQQIGLAATKNLFDIQMVPGDSYSGDFAVFNQSQEVALPVHIQFSLWDLKEDSDDIAFVTSEPALNAARWFSVEGGNDFILEPDGAQEIRFRIQVPPDAALKTYLVMMRFQAVLPEHYFTEEGPRFVPEIGVLFFIGTTPLNVGGEGGGYDADILSFAPKGGHPLPLLATILPKAEAGAFESIVETMTARVENSGQYHFKASGWVDIQNVFGQSIARAEVPTRYLLPGRTRSFDIAVLHEQSFWGRATRFGPYSATMVLAIPGRDTPVVEYATFWVFPWKTLLAGIFVALAILFLQRRVVRAARTRLRGKLST
jgi:hypothetical protein